MTFVQEDIFENFLKYPGLLSRKIVLKTDDNILSSVKIFLNLGSPGKNLKKSTAFGQKKIFKIFCVTKIS